MKLINLLIRISFILLCLIIFGLITFLVLKPIFVSESLIFPYSVHPFDICISYPKEWDIIKLLYILFWFLSSIIISNSICSLFINKFKLNKQINKISYSPSNNTLNLFIGYSEINNEKIFIPEKGLYQNMLITGTIGSGKTSSSMYPFVKQLIKYKCNNPDEKLGMLILDVKGNFHKQVRRYSEQFDREDDLLVLGINDETKYNPLHKPNLKPAILANRLKTILTLFSPNVSDSYWLDKVEQVLTECIKFCRLYNDGYVTFLEIHNLINDSNYYKEKIEILRELFQSNAFNENNTYDLLSSINFFEKEFNSLDSRVLSILKSEINRITLNFVSDYDVLKTFCPNKDDLNFHGFSDLLKSGKIVVLNMNIAEYRNLSKIIATYLKLDFQSEVLSNISNNISSRITSFICDEYHEYVTSTDNEFFALCREAKCISIVATQSYTSLLSTLKDSSCTKAIIQNLINKLWYRTDDMFTIEDVQKQMGKEEKERISTSISENAKETNYDYFTSTLKSKNSSLSESVNTFIQSDFIYDTNFFTQELETFSALGFFSDGAKILKPCKLKMLPYFQKDSQNTSKKFI